ncbi:MAG TPA: hypothetical protein PK107_06570 [Candidatus Omnitrophota bacterium]|nr:hypothetical protein [Candidatus Omnitrophota bacterium]HQO38464.1 hypothetical protein [Candidatus Omnitrophota bacterium]
MNTTVSIEKIRKLYKSERLSINDISNRLGISFWNTYSLMNEYGINRRNPSMAGFAANRNKPQYKIKRSLTNRDKQLKIAGIMLYWAEGTFNGNTVDFTNSNAEMIKIFLKFLRKICGINEERLRVYLYAYEHQNISELQDYWHTVTNIKLSQFTKPFIRKNNLNVTKRKLPYGLVHIRYNDKKLLGSLKSWIDNYICWTGTQVAKGDRL